MPINTQFLDSISRENLRIKEERRKSGNPFYRGIVSLYVQVRRDGRTDIEATIERTKDLGANCFTYLIYGKDDFDLFPEFCAKAGSEGIEVWAYLVPPSEAPIGRDRPPEERKYPPFDLDYIRWTKELAEISLKYPNFTLWMIDDFYYNLWLFTPEYTGKVYKTMKTINPKLNFGICIYFEQIMRFISKGYLPYFDAILWGYQHAYSFYPYCGLTAITLPLEINHFYKTCPSKIVIPGIYFSPHSSWPKGRPTKEYLKEATEIAYEQAGIVWVFTTPNPRTFQYEVVKEFTSSTSIPLLR